MKYLVTLLLASLALARPEDPPAPKTKTPAGCRAIITDESYPSPEVWKKELPTSELRNTEMEGEGHTEYKIRPKVHQEVVDAVKFAKKYNLRLSIMNSGHDFVGRNDAPTGLLIDTGALRGIHVLEEFVPTEKGAEKPGEKVNVIVPKPGKQAAVTIGVGISTQMLNDALDKSKLVTVGAAHGSVAPAGGFGQTGGHSPISDIYGLGSDNLLELQVVTADGTLRVANKVSNPDLYWALRGGGGSTFGVVVQATIKAHPTVPITAVSWTLNSSTGVQNPGIWDSYAALHRLFPDLADNRGVSSYYYHYGSRIGALFLHKGEHAGKAKAEAYWKPAVAELEKFPNVKITNFTIVEYPTFKAYFDARFGAIDNPNAPRPEAAPWDQRARRRYVNGMFEPFILTKRHEPEQTYEPSQPKFPVGLDSRLLGKEHFESKNLSAALRAAFPIVEGFPPLIQGHLIGGNKVFKPDDPDTAVVPAWRKAYSHLIIWRNATTHGADSLRLLAPDSGAYCNEAFPSQPDWKKAFWGVNYDRLSQIKSKYDPDMLFWVSPGINADHAETNGGRQCKRTTPYTANIPPRSDNPNFGAVLPPLTA